MALWTRGGKAGTPSGVADEPPAVDEALVSAGAPDGEVPPGPTGPQGWLNGQADGSMIATLLSDVIDPEIGVNIVDLGLVYAIRISDGTASIRMSLTTPGCPLSAYMEDSIHRVLWGSPGIDDVDLQIIWEPPWSPDMMSRRAKQELGWPG